MSSKQTIKSAENWRKARINEYTMYLLGLLHNSIEIEGLPDDVPKRYFLGVLFKRGQIGYANNLYLPVSGVGVDVYGLPTEYIFTAYNGVVFQKKAKDSKILRINDQSYPIVPYLKMQAELLTDVDTAIRQNLFAVRTQAVYECKDQASLLSLQNQFKARAIGTEVIFLSKSAMGEDKLTVHPTEAEYIGDKLIALKEDILNETLGRIGVMSSASNKKERVQSAEVNATIGIVVDNVYVMIDTFNHDAEVAGLDLKMKLNTVTEEYYSLGTALQSGQNKNGTNEVGVNNPSTISYRDRGKK